ncbi:MAG: tRNA lysidine(34) synthetase TilS [Rhizomicrobium sp.]
MDTVVRQGASWPGAIAVSGGGDSIGLLLLLAEWARATGQPPPSVLTVNHGLRPAAAQEAAAVAARSRAWGLDAHVLAWRGRKPLSDIEGAAREARYRLMGAWCRANGIGCLYVGHTIDDQAETFLLRLARGSGVDGLAAMTEVSPFPVSDWEAIRVVRPLLSVSRARVRAFLAGRGETWLEDDMNANPRFARARLRAAWPALEKAGLSVERIAAASRHLARARAALDHDTVQLLLWASLAKGEYVLLDGAQIVAAPEEVGLRALARVLMHVSGQPFRPRFERLERLLGAIRADALRGGRTLHGCCIGPAVKRDRSFGAQTLRIGREIGRQPGESCK